MDIVKLLERRKRYPCGSKETNVNEIDYITSELTSNEDVVGIALPTSFLNKKMFGVSTLKKLIFDDWYVLGIYDLSRIFEPYAGVDFNLICLGKKPPENITFSKYEGVSTFVGDRSCVGVAREFGKQVITDEYLLYLHELSSIIKNHEDKFFESKGSIFIAPSKLLDYEHLSVNYYHPDLVENQNKLDQENTVLLSEVAKIIAPKKSGDEMCLLFGPANFTYPIRIDNVKEGKKTNVMLRKGDILLSKLGSHKAFLVNEELSGELFSSIYTFVIRCDSKIVSAEYLFLYLQSDTAKKYIIRNQSGVVVNSLSNNSLNLLPVIVPEKTVVDRSKVLFKILFENPVEDTVSVINFELFSKAMPKKPIQIEFIEEFLNKSKGYKLELIKRMVDEDLKEIKGCIKIQAYKSATILSGSVLEAVLLDWLSEVDGVNYFESKAGLKLNNIINKLSEKKYLDNNAKTSAHNIRSQRNLVHPKEYLRTENIIDKNTTINTMSDLESVLRQRL